VESVENSKDEFPTLSTALGNPAKGAGFPHFHSDGGGCLTHEKTKEKQWHRVTFLSCKTIHPKVTFSNCLTGSSAGSQDLGQE
jgi:hypothetical protein